MLLTVRRAAFEAAVVDQRQLHALVVTAPQPGAGPGGPALR
jgi:hypothetical protein